MYNGCEVHNLLPSVEEETIHVEVIVCDKHVCFHPQLQDGGRTDWPHNGHKETVFSHQLHLTRDVHQLEVDHRGIK